MHRPLNPPSLRWNSFCRLNLETEQQSYQIIFFHLPFHKNDSKQRWLGQLFHLFVTDLTTFEFQFLSLFHFQLRTSFFPVEKFCMPSKILDSAKIRLNWIAEYQKGMLFDSSLKHFLALGRLVLLNLDLCAIVARALMLLLLIWFDCHEWRYSGKKIFFRYRVGWEVQHHNRPTLKCTLNVKCVWVYVCERERERDNVAWSSGFTHTCTHAHTHTRTKHTYLKLYTHVR